MTTGTAAGRAHETVNSTTSLTPRERQVLELAAKGATSREAAQALGISMRTVEAHRRHILAKTGARYISDLFAKS